MTASLATPNDTIVRTSALSKVFTMGHRQVDALRKVELAIAAGELVSIVGPSGSGKSTLLHILGCLERPSSGQLWIDRQEVASLSAKALPAIRQRKLGFVFQEFNLLPTLTSLENVMLPLRYAHADSRAGRRRAEALLERVGLGQRHDHRPAELSGGEQQRVAIARALINHPALLLADEPTGELDSATSQSIMALLQELNADGQTVVIVTHDPAVAALTHRRISLRDGQIVSDERQASRPTACLHN